MSRPTKGSLFDIGISTPKEGLEERFTEFKRDDLFVAIPATVVKVSDYGTLQCVDVKPVLDFKWIDDVVITSPIIKKVFVKLYSTGSFSIQLPMTIGDLVTLQYSHKAISNWLDSQGSDLTQSVDLEAMERDCWVEPGFGTRKNHQNPSTTDMVIKGPETTITIPPDGNITIVTSGTSELTSGGHTINADVSIVGTLNVTEDATFVKKVTAEDGDFATTLKIASGELNGHGHVIASGSSAGTTDPFPP